MSAAARPVRNGGAATMPAPRSGASGMPLERRGRSSSRPPVSASLTAGRRGRGGGARIAFAAPAGRRLPDAAGGGVAGGLVRVVGSASRPPRCWWARSGVPSPDRGRLRAPTPAEAAVLAVAALWVLATAAGGVFDPRNPDFFDYRVTLLDLGRHPWPTYLPDPLAAWRPAPAEGPPATPPLLRYYLGWHMIPGLAAHWLGPGGTELGPFPCGPGPGWPSSRCCSPADDADGRWSSALAVLVFFSGMTFAGSLAIKGMGVGRLEDRKSGTGTAS